MTTKPNKKAATAIRGKWVWMLALTILFGELLLYTWCRVQCVNTGYAISRESRTQQELKTLQNNLRIELARLKAPENLSRIARGSLALGMPDVHQVIVVP